MPPVDEHTLTDEQRRRFNSKLVDGLSDDADFTKELSLVMPVFLAAVSRCLILGTFVFLS